MSTDTESSKQDICTQMIFHSKRYQAYVYTHGYFKGPYKEVLGPLSYHFLCGIRSFLIQKINHDKVSKENSSKTMTRWLFQPI